MELEEQLLMLCSPKGHLAASWEGLAPIMALLAGMNLGARTKMGTKIDSEQMELQMGLQMGLQAGLEKLEHYKRLER